jgi:hypothetical protein
MYENEIESFQDIQDVEIMLWTEKEIKQLMSDKFPKQVLEAFNTMKMYPWKAELARFCILFEHGGFYSDFGITFLKQIDTSNCDLIIFKDNPVQKMFNERFVVQTALIFAKPKNDAIYKTIIALASMYANREYGRYPYFITGEHQLAEAIDPDSGIIITGEFGENFVSMEDLYKDNQILEYKIDGELVALFKSIRKNERLKSMDSSKTDVLKAWSERNLYEDSI